MIAKELSKENTMTEEIRKLIENLEKGKKIQIEYDSKNEILKAWELKLHKIKVKEEIDERTKKKD